MKSVKTEKHLEKHHHDVYTLDHTCVCTLYNTVGGNMHKVGLQTTATHTKKKPFASSARRYLFTFTAIQPVSALVWKTSLDNQSLT